jgi:hypothetical protein
VRWGRQGASEAEGSGKKKKGNGVGMGGEGAASRVAWAWADGVCWGNGRRQEARQVVVGSTKT